MAWKDATSDRYQCIKMKTTQLKPFLLSLSLRIRQSMGIADNAKEGDSDFDRIILKMGINVDDGFIYFNEMLYRIMRSQFVTAKGMRYNKAMTIQELVTQFKIAEIVLKEKSSRKISKAEREQAFFDQHAAQPVNLFLTKMFFKTSLLAWRNQMRAHLSKQRHEKEMAIEKAICMEQGKDFVQKPYPKNEAPKVEIEIEYEKNVILSCSSDEESLTEVKSRKSGSSRVKRRSSLGKGNQEDSPENFRRKARLRLAASTKKFSIDPVQIQILSSINSLKLTSPRQTTPRQKTAMIVHSKEEAIATQDHKFVDPNSMEYTNIVLEQKINKHTKQISEKQLSGIKLGDLSGRDEHYSGSFTKRNLNISLRKLESEQKLRASPECINAPPKIIRNKNNM